MELHIADHDLERYYLGMIEGEDELAQLEEHLLCCPECVNRAEQTQHYVDALRVALAEPEESYYLLAGE
jgi:anti-sigma factor RsiW